MKHTLLIKDWLYSFLFLLFPRCCVVCGRSLVKGEECICTLCNLNLPRTNYHLREDNPVERLFWGRIPLGHATSFFFYRKGSDFRQILHQLKYGGRKGIGAIMGRYMASELLASGFFQGIDVIIGGPPCQAYSVAGRVRDENGMRDDYRNYLFEHYLSVVNRYRPKVFVFENVPGILSAAPDGTPITDLIKQGFANIGYDIIGDLKITKVNASDYGVPQNRERMIIVGIDNRKYKNTQKMLNTFYKEILPKYKVTKKITVKEAIGDLPACEPFYDEEHHKKRKSHTVPELNITWHKPRYHNLRDMDTFRILAKDIESGKREYNSKKISELYEKKVGSKSPIHRYHVLEPDLPSTTIIAHLYKDGNRFIHYDSKQCRSITVREAARLQSFDDDFDFVGAQGNAYQMIGNAVPPQLAKRVALALGEMLDEID